MGEKNVNTEMIMNKDKSGKTADDKWVLRLYVAGQSPKALTAFENLKKICQEQLEGKYSIEVIDLLKNPQLGAEDQILALPTLVRKLPVPVRKIIGDLSNTERVLVGLNLLPQSWIEETNIARHIMKKHQREIEEKPGKFELHMPDQNQDRYILRLYITGTTNRSIMAITNLKKICEEYLEGKYDLEVIDLYKSPKLAKGEQIIAAPTLIKELPLPFRRIIGDMSNKEKVLLGLDLRGVEVK